MGKYKGLSDALLAFSLSTENEENKDEDFFDDPFGSDEDDIEKAKEEARLILSDEEEKSEKRGKKQGKKKKQYTPDSDDDEKFNRTMEEANRTLEKYGESFDMDFQTYVDNASNYDEDADLKESLIAQGRKYQRSHAVDEDESEVVKAFQPQEKELKEFTDEVNKELNLVSKDIAQIRSTGYGVNRKQLSELIGQKTSLLSLKLNAIKEKSNNKKIQFDILEKQAKNKANKNSGQENSTAAISGIQKLMSMGHSAMINSVGGREASAGCPDDYDYEDFEDSDEVLQEKYFSNDTRTSEGDIYLKYEGKGVHYVLNYDETDPNNCSIFAEDGEGNIVPEYPIPEIEGLHFDVDRTTLSATDDCGRDYTVRYINEDNDEE